jgi:2,3-bisphosphoglycerate-independent phosphoglycerate mutase
MGASPARALLLFLDGVGIGSNDPRINPLAAARLPTLDRLLEGRGPLLGEAVSTTAPARFAAVDARLGVEGLPQSGTGQTSLLAGVNAARLIGRHFGPWVHTGLRDRLARDNLLSRTRRAGRLAAFANAYPSVFLERAAARLLRRPAAPPFAASAAGVLTRDEADLRAGRAVASEIEHTAWRERLDPTLPLITAAAAGAVLAKITTTADMTLFAHYATDTIGHTRDLAAGIAAIERVDAFLGGLVGKMPADLLLVIASDHGNIEDVTAAHTLNRVPLIAVGRGAGDLVAGIQSIAEVAPRLLRLIGIDDRAPDDALESI